jgi:signal peptidase II
MPFYLSALLALAIDLISKWLIRLHLQVGDTMSVWNGVLEFTHYRNGGAARGLFQGYGRLFSLFAVLFITAVLYYRKKGQLRGTLLEIGTGLLAGGAAGNGIERIVFGKVTDFLVFGSGDGILNMADLFINLGTLLTVAGLLWNERRKKKHPGLH